MKLCRFPICGSSPMLTACRRFKKRPRSEFVKTYYGVSLRWMEKLLKGDAEPKPDVIEEDVPTAATASREEGQADTAQPAASTESESDEDEDEDEDSDAVAAAIMAKQTRVRKTILRNDMRGEFTWHYRWPQARRQPVAIASGLHTPRA